MRNSRVNGACFEQIFESTVKLFEEIYFRYPYPNMFVSSYAHILLVRTFLAGAKILVFNRVEYAVAAMWPFTAFHFWFVHSWYPLWIADL